jgi:TM2 domain-containing membrane protein YozV
MLNPYRLLLVLGIAGASLTSCSRANYAFQSTAPAYLGTERVASSASQTPALEAAAVPASATAALTTTPVDEAPEARLAAHALAHPAARLAPKTAAPEAPIAGSAKTLSTRVERKALKKELKRQLSGAPTGVAAEGKSQLVAALLCFFLGGLGIHDFYLGRPGKGILQILLTLLFGIGFILVLIDFVRILLGTEKPKDGEYAKKL